MKKKTNYFVDLHIHTCASDGSATVSEILESACSEKLNLISITDHDSIEAWNQIAKQFDKTTICCIPGIEISTIDGNKYIHVLGYGFNPEEKGILDICRINKEAFIKKDQIFIEGLIDIGYPIEKQEYEQFQYDRTKGGWKVLNYLIKKGLCTDIHGFLQTFKPGGVLPYAELVSPETAIQVIHKAGGYAVLAHPGAYIKEEQELSGLLIRYQDYGIDGVECYTFKNSEYVKQKCIAFCRQYGLMITGGSDYHGTFSRDARGLSKLEGSLLELKPLFFF